MPESALPYLVGLLFLSGGATWLQTKTGAQRAIRMACSVAAFTAVAAAGLGIWFLRAGYEATEAVAASERAATLAAGVWRANLFLGGSIVAAVVGLALLVVGTLQHLKVSRSYPKR